MPPVERLVSCAACVFRTALVVGLSILVARTDVVHAADPAPVAWSEVAGLLKSRCVACHGPVRRQGGLRLDVGRLAVQGGESGAGVVPGRRAESRLLQRVTASDPEERMPPEGKPLSADEIDLLARWIDGGARHPRDEPIPASPADHWAFRPVVRPRVPEVQDPTWVRNPIDAFVLAGLERRGWRPSAPASPEALLRRVHLDLVGLPPTPDEQRRFAENTSPAALDELVDALLARPGHGERWARHWLDVARYADSNGYERDAEKPFVWRYRDWVIRALEEDLPFDRFVLEQLAGDELPDRTAESTIATGFLRLGHWDDEPADPETDRYDQLDDVLTTTAQAFLGLTIGCARCHDHKFEPLAARDYYRMLSVFAPLERPRNGRQELTVAIPAKVSSDPAAGGANPPPLPVYAWREPSPKPPESHVLLRGSPTRKGERVEPGVPEILAARPVVFPAPDGRTTRRRLGLARWIASADNPLTARVIVNRVWQQHFGQGLVRTANDFGLMGTPPVHPALLDWLADWFVHDADWSLKRLHRLILTSSTWRMARTARPEYAAADPDDRLLWRVPPRRLEVEALRDAMLAVSRELNPKRFGPAMRPPVPAAVLEANADKQKVWQASDEREASRRTVYAFVKRGLVVPLLETLDFADTVASCPQRQVTTVAPQALALFNGEFANRQAERFALRLRNEAGPDPSTQIRLAWRLALCRDPRDEELAAARRFLDDESQRGANEPRTADRPAASDAAQHAALVQLCRVVLNLNEFAYPE